MRLQRAHEHSAAKRRVGVRSTGLLALALLFAPSFAAAEEPKAAVLEMSGHRGKALREAILRELDLVVALVPHEAEADLIVRGFISGKSAEIAIIGRDGDRLGTTAGRIRSRADRKKLAKKTARWVQNALNKLEAADESALEVAIEEPKQKAVLKPEPEPKAPIVEASKPKPEVQAELTTPEAAPRSDRRIALFAGFDVRGRTAKIDLSDGRRAVHETGPFPELAVHVEAKPFGEAPLSGLFAAAEFEIEVGLSSIERTEEVRTDALRAGATVGYLFDLGALELGGGFGFGVDRFALGENDVLDSTTYSYVRIAAIGRALLFDAVRIDLQAGLRPVVNTGELGDRWSQSATALGFEVGGGVGHETQIGFAYGLSALFSGYTMRFGSSDRLSATGGWDSSIAVGISLGWVIK